MTQTLSSSIKANTDRRDAADKAAQARNSRTSLIRYTGRSRSLRDAHGRTTRNNRVRNAAIHTFLKNQRKHNTSSGKQVKQHDPLYGNPDLLKFQIGRLLSHDIALLESGDKPSKYTYLIGTGIEYAPQEDALGGAVLVLSFKGWSTYALREKLKQIAGLVGVVSLEDVPAGWHQEEDTKYCMVYNY